MCHVTCRWPWQPRPVMPCSWRPGPRTPPPRPGAGAEEQPSGCWGPQGGGELGPASPLPSPADEATLALMRTPRCSLPDLPAVAPARRRRQATAPAKWNKRSLSWRWGGALPGAEQTQWGATGTDSGRRVPRSWWRHRSPHLSHLCRLSPNRVPVPKPGQDAPGGTPRPVPVTGPSLPRPPAGSGSEPSHGTRPWAVTPCGHSCTTRSRSGATSRPWTSTRWRAAPPTSRSTSPRPTTPTATPSMARAARWPTPSSPATAPLRGTPTSMTTRPGPSALQVRQS